MARLPVPSVPRLTAALALAVLAAPSQAQLRPGTVERIWKLSQTRGGVMPVLDNDDQLGRAIAALGDLDGNGVVDLVTAGLGDDDGGADQGAAYVLFLRPDGHVLRHQKISALSGGFTGELSPRDQFGRALAGIGDLDGDGVPDLAVGANYDDDGGWNRGAVWLLCLNTDGTVKSTHKISSLEGGLVGPLHDSDEFGRSVTALGDLDGDGDPDVAVGAPTDNTGGSKRGAVWILFLNPDGTVQREVKIAHQTGGFTGRLHSLDWFGFSLANLGDFDGDGVTDLAVGAALDDDGGENAGAVWLLFLNPDGTVKDQRKISSLSGGFTGPLESPDQFGTSVAALGDGNGDGITELAVGAVKDGDGGPERGAVYVLFLARDGSVAFHQKISDLEGGFPSGRLGDFDWFGSALAPLGDLDHDGVPDLAIGVRNDDDGGLNRGALYLTYLKGQTRVWPGSGPAPAPPVLVDLGPGAGGWGAGGGDDPSDEEGASAGAEDARALPLGVGADPGRTLERVASPEAPDSIRLRLRAPARLADEGATARLLIARDGLRDSVRVARGAALDPRTFLGSLAALPGASDDEFEFRLQLPPRSGVRCLAVQVLWSSRAGLELGEALELVLDGP